MLLAAYLLVVTLALQGEVGLAPFVIAAVSLAALAFGRRQAEMPAWRRPNVVLAAGLLAWVVVAGRLVALAHPQSAFEFVFVGALVAVNVAALVRRPVVGLVLAGVVVAVGAFAGFTAYSATPMAGDVRLRAYQFEWDRVVFGAEAGRIAVFVDNQDPAHHDFTIKGVVATQVPAEKARRAVFDVEPGKYRFYCTVHPDAMEGTLTVVAP